MTGRHDGEPSHSRNLAALVSTLTLAVEKAARARSASAIEWELATANRAHATFLRYVLLFSIPPAEVPELPDVPAPDSARLAELKRAEAGKAALKAVAAKEKARAFALECHDLLIQWRAGVNVPLPYNCPPALRIEGEGADSEVVTSRGARVPVSHALRGLAFVRKVVASGQEYQRNGHTLHLGHYTIDRIESDGTLHAGCHVIAYAEIEALAPTLLSLAHAAHITADTTDATDNPPA